MNSSVCRIGQSCGRSAMQKNHTERCTVWVQTSERWKKGDLILQPWRGYRYKTGRVEYFGKCWSPWIFTRDCLEFTQHGARNILWAGWNTLMMMSEIGGAWPDWSDPSWVYSNSNKHSLHPWWAEKHLGTDNTRIFVGESLPWIFCPLREEIDGL